MRGQVFPAIAALALGCSLAPIAAAQDAAPVSLDFGPEETTTRAHDESVLASAREAGVERLRVRYVKVEGRWADRVPLPLVAGEILTRDKLSAAMNALRVAITAPAGPTLALRSKGEIGVLYIDVKFDTGPVIDAQGNARPAPDTVGVIFRPYYIQISLVEIGNNVLPIPRSALPTFREGVPAWLAPFNPAFGVSYDRAFGTAVSLGLATDALHFLPASDSPQHLDLRLEGTDRSRKLSTGRTAARATASNAALVGCANFPSPPITPRSTSH